jgi:NTE family protein
MLRSGLHWILALVTGGWLVHPPHAMFDCAPLWALLRKELHFDGIPRGIYKGHLEAIGICATSYYDAHSVTFFAGAGGVEPWRRAMRKGERVQLTLPHLMASIAIPFMFRPIPIGGEFYGDGAMRQTSPLSPAFHLGADRLLVIGVGASDFIVPDAANSAGEPSFGHLFGFMLDSLFLDQINTDVELINILNRSSGARPVRTLIMMPSEEVGVIARRHAHELPRSLRVLMRAVGANDTGGTHLLSYILFERGFTQELIELGYRDASARAEELLEFLGLEAAVGRRMRGNVR